MSQDKYHHALPEGHQVQWYTIEQVLGQGGFGITYLAHDNNLDQRVAIKEYFPGEFARRNAEGLIQPISPDQAEMYQWGLERFISEARTLAKFDHPNIVRVMAVFEEKQSAYIVMRYEEGDTLDQRFKSQGILSESELLDILLPILDGLSIVHDAGFIHRDIKPANIFIRDDNSPVLIDFGSARQAIGEHTQTLTTLISPGYSPIEQYYTKGEDQGPWTDIYGLASTIYYGLAGKRPVDTMTRSKHILGGTADPYIPAAEEGKGRYSSTFLDAVDRAMAFHHQHRPANLASWKTLLTREPGTEMPKPVSADAPTQPADGISPATQATQVAEHVMQSSDPTEAGVTQGATHKVENKRRARWPWVVGVLILIVVIALIKIQGKNSRSTLPVSADKPATVSDTQPLEIADDASTIKALLEQAGKDVAADRLTIPKGNNAFERYRAVLKIDKENKAAREGLENIVKRKMSIIENHARQGELGKAEENVQHLLDLVPDNKKLKTLMKRISEARKQQRER